MKKIMVLVGMCLVLSLNCNAETIKLDIGDWAPYTSPDDPKGKIAETIVIEAFKLAGVSVELSYYPWKRSYDNVIKGKAAGTFPWFVTEERKHGFIIPKETLVKAQTVFFHLKSTAFDWNSLEDLKGFKISVPSGYEDEKILKTAGVKIETVQNEEANYKKLLSGRIDLATGNLFVGYGLVNRLFSPEDVQKVVNHPKPLIEGNMYVLISKKIPNGQAIADKFDMGMKALKTNGVYERIIREALTQ